MKNRAPKNPDTIRSKYERKKSARNSLPANSGEFRVPTKPVTRTRRPRPYLK